MKLKFLTIALLALGFTACDTYEETDDVANQRAEQEAFVKAENLKDAYNEYASAYSDWYKKSDSITSIEKNINKYKQSLILLETDYDEATVKAIIESDKAQYEDDLTVEQARLEVLETANVDVEALRTKIDSLDNAILALGDNENNVVYDSALVQLFRWNTEYNEDNRTTFIWGEGFDVTAWAEKAILTKDSLSIAVEQPKIDLDKANIQLADSKEAYYIALEAYTENKIKRAETKATKDAAQADFDIKNEALTVAESAEKVAQEIYDEDDSVANKTALDSAKIIVADAQKILDDATSELKNATATFDTDESEYYAAETAYETEIDNYESKQNLQKTCAANYKKALAEFNKFNIETLKAELTELNATFAESCNIFRKIKTLKAQKEAIENTMFFIEANYDNLSATETYLETEISTVEDTIKDLEKDIAELDKDLAKIAAGVYNLSSNYDIDLTATQIQEAIASYEAKLVASNDLLAAAKTQLDNAKAAYEALLAQNTETDDDEEVPAGE